MSTQNSQLTDFTNDDGGEQAEDGGPQWSPQSDGGDGQTRCSNCGAHVTPDFVRVFGSNDGEVWACRDCSTATAIRGGAGRGKDAEAHNLADGGQHVR